MISTAKKPLAEDRKRESLSQATERKTNEAAHTAAQTAAAVKQVKKAAAAAASGNYAKAVIEALKSETVRKAVLYAVVIGTACFFFIAVVFLYALPMMLFNTVETFYSGAADGYYESIVSSADVDSTYWVQVRSVWNGIISALSSDEKDANTDLTEIDADSDEELEEELSVTYAESAETDVLWDRVETTKEKIRGRAESLAEGLTTMAQYSLKQYYVSALISQYNGQYAGRTDENGIPYGDISASDINVSINSAINISDTDAVKIMSIYTVLMGDDISNAPLTDYQRWLGYDADLDFSVQHPGTSLGMQLTPAYSVSSFFISSLVNSRTTISIENTNTDITIDRWVGSCVPQYLAELGEMETDTYGETVCYGNATGIAAADLLLEITAPKVSECIPVFSTVAYTTGTEADDTGAAETDEGSTSDGENTGDTETDGETVTYKHPAYSVSINIGIRDGEELLEILGIIGSDEAADVTVYGADDEDEIDEEDLTDDALADLAMDQYGISSANVQKILRIISVEGYSADDTLNYYIASVLINRFRANSTLDIYQVWESDNASYSAENAANAEIQDYARTALYKALTKLNENAWSVRVMDESEYPSDVSPMYKSRRYDASVWDSSVEWQP